MLTVKFFKSRMESLGMEDRWEEISSGDFEINHFVDLLRHVQLKPVKESSESDEMKLKKQTTPSVTSYTRQSHVSGAKKQKSI